VDPRQARGPRADPHNRDGDPGGLGHHAGHLRLAAQRGCGGGVEQEQRVEDRGRTPPLAFLRDLFGGLAYDEPFTAVFTDALSALHAKGARETLRAWSTRVTT